MTGPTLFQVGAAVVAALAPESPAPYLLSWMNPPDDVGKRVRDFLSRGLFFAFLVDVQCFLTWMLS